MIEDMQTRWLGIGVALAALVLLVVAGLSLATYVAWWAFENLMPLGA